MISHGNQLGMGPDEIDDHVKQAAFNLVAGELFHSTAAILVRLLRIVMCV